MPRDKEFTIVLKELGDPEPDLGLNKDNLKFADNQKQVVQVLIDGEPADVTYDDKKPDSIKVKAPTKGEGPWTIVVSTQDEKTILSVLELSLKGDSFGAKQQQEIA